MPSKRIRDTYRAEEAGAAVANAMTEARRSAARPGEEANRRYEADALCRSYHRELAHVAGGVTPLAASARELVAHTCGPRFENLRLPYPLGTQWLDVFRPFPHHHASYWDEVRDFSEWLATIEQADPA